MPIYEYQCQACGSVQELLQKISDPAPEACAKCAKGPMTKLMSRTNFALKGGGWYVTDFRGGSSSGQKKDEKKDEAPVAAESKPAETKAAEAPKSEAPAPKAESKGAGA